MARISPAGGNSSQMVPGGGPPSAIQRTTSLASRGRLRRAAGQFQLRHVGQDSGRRSGGRIVHRGQSAEQAPGGDHVALPSQQPAGPLDDLFGLSRFNGPDQGSAGVGILKLTQLVNRGQPYFGLGIGSSGQPQGVDQPGRRPGGAQLPDGLDSLGKSAMPQSLAGQLQVTLVGRAAQDVIALVLSPVGLRRFGPRRLTGTAAEPELVGEKNPEDKQDQAGDNQGDDGQGQQASPSPGSRFASGHDHLGLEGRRARKNLGRVSSQGG
ncbi:MAG: hypothetical protein GWP05_04600 [Anaerolineaceae bacterium]|nr:hypothetical protein [Anaerolineaceae bacterium]